MMKLNWLSLSGGLRQSASPGIQERPPSRESRNSESRGAEIATWQRERTPLVTKDAQVSLAHFLSRPRLYNAMCNYARGDGKKLHDPLAMAVAVDEGVCHFEEVRVYRDSKGWGSVLEAGTNTWISVDYDDERFRQIILGAVPG